MLKMDTIENYIENLSSSLPAPGGGVAAAITGVQGVALLEMVCNLTIGKKKFINVEKEMTDILNKLTPIRSLMMDSADQDKMVFEKVMSAYSLKNMSDNEKKHKVDEIELALKEASQVPFELMGLSLKAMKYIKKLEEMGNPNLISDVDVGAHLLKSCILCSEINVEINLKSIKDDQFCIERRDAIQRIFSNVEACLL